MPIRTPRLDLHPLPPALIRAVLAGDVAAAAALAPFPVDAGTFADDEYVLRLRLSQLEVDPADEPWLYRAAVTRASGRVVGRGGFHAPPDPEGTVEIGYSVEPLSRGNGLATEIAAGLLRWAAEHGATRCLASIRPDNAPSLALSRRLGFERIGEQVDEIDGLEWVLARALDGPLPTYDGRR